jgi:hypothetical protein
MATLTFEFQGIAIHMTQFSPYRVIIPTGPVPTGFTLNPTITPSALAPLDGVTFTVGSGQTPSAQIDAIPKLSELYPAMIVNPDAVSGQQLPAAAYFDFEGGSVTVARNAHSRYAQVAVEFDGDQASLQVQRWNAPDIATIQLPLPQTIVIQNVPRPHVTAFTPAEYMSNFVIAQNFPQGFELIQVGRAVTAALKPPSSTNSFRFDTFPSCSNSQWP